MGLFRSQLVAGLISVSCPVLMLLRRLFLGRVTGILEDYLVPVIPAVREQIVRILNLQVGVFPSGSVFGDLLDRDGSRVLYDAHGLLSSTRDGSWFSGSSASDPDPHKDYSLFGFVSEPSSSI